MHREYSLALGGGAARGFAHIGVIKYIEEKNINITEVSGTSMGAIIGALYAMGKTYEDISNIAKSINFIKLIDIDLKEGLLKGNKVYKILEKIFEDKKIEELNKKLKIVATNLENGQKVIFKTGKIVDAIRASISLPGIFKPYTVEGNSYIDGGVINNLPIEVLDGKYVIAVSALKKVNSELQRNKKLLGINFRLGFFSLNFQILQRTIILMMKQNEDRSIHDSKKEVILIYPEYGLLDFYSFKQIKELVEVGYNKAKEILGLLYTQKDGKS